MNDRAEAKVQKLGWICVLTLFSQFSQWSSVLWASLFTMLTLNTQTSVETQELAIISIA